MLGASAVIGVSEICSPLGEDAAYPLAATAHPGLQVRIGQHGASPQLDPCAGTALEEEPSMAGDLEPQDHRGLLLIFQREVDLAPGHGAQLRGQRELLMR